MMLQSGLQSFGTGPGNEIVERRFKLFRPVAEHGESFGNISRIELILVTEASIQEPRVCIGVSAVEQWKIGDTCTKNG